MARRLAALDVAATPTHRRIALYRLCNLDGRPSASECRDAVRVEVSLAPQLIVGELRAPLAWFDRADGEVLLH